jgi:hypothetical protein
VASGGLISYGPNYPGLFRRAAYYVNKILRGANPAELPVEEPNLFDLRINLKTAKALGLPPSPTSVEQLSFRFRQRLMAGADGCLQLRLSIRCHRGPVRHTSR